MQTWRLDDGRQTLVLAAKRERLPEVIYWGASLPATEDLECLFAAHGPGYPVLVEQGAFGIKKV